MEWGMDELDGTIISISVYVCMCGCVYELYELLWLCVCMDGSMDGWVYVWLCRFYNHFSLLSISLYNLK